MLAASALDGDDRFDPRWQRVFRECGYGALLAVPVEAPGSDEAGMAVVFFSGEQAIGDDDLELARNLAAAARGALERSDLYESERRSRALAQQLAHAGATLVHELDPDAVAEEVVARAQALVAADAATIRLLEGEELTVTAATGDGADALVSTRTQSTAWPAGDVVQSRAPVAIENVATDVPFGVNLDSASLPRRPTKITLLTLRDAILHAMYHSTMSK